MLRIRTFAGVALVATFGLLAAGSVEGRPIPSLYPGGVPVAVTDTVVIEMPVRLAPSLLSLRVAGPLAPPVPGQAVAADSSTTLLRAFANAPFASSDPAEGTMPRSGSLGATSDPRAEDAILFSGLKTFSVEMGTNRDATLEQSLDLTVRGRIAGDVELAATLSDRQLPFEPDGSSRELEDLDRIALSVRAPRAEATMGDFALDGIPGEFARMSRQLEGVRGFARTGDTRWNVAAASAKGERQSLELRGEEGRQGPYELLARTMAQDRNGVVSGSEVVWLDGSRMRRGADEDYVIDYGAGTITFTVRRPITAQSRIAIDFEAGSSRYKRTLYAATSQGGIRGAGAWHASYVSEGDDSGSPLGAELSAEDKDALSQLGDSAVASSALPSGVQYRGPGAGSYAWDESDPASPRWVYLGAMRGDFDVEFASVGPGRGAYGDTLGLEGERFYRYRGENLGEYVPGRAVPVPSSRSLMDVGASARLFGSLSLDAEVARSALDPNALSSRDDGDNGGLAARFAARLEPRPLAIGGWNLGRVKAEALVRSRGDRFRAFDRIDPAFESERWNQAPSEGGEDRQEFMVRYEPLSGLAVNGEIGHRSLAGGSRSIRQAAHAEIRTFLTGAARWEEARNSTGLEDGYRSTWTFDLSRATGAILPRVAAREERIRGQEGDSVAARESREVTVGLGVAPSQGLRFRGGYGVREGHVWESAIDPGIAEHAETWEGGISARSGSAFSFEGGYTRREARTGTADQTTHLAQLAVTGGAPGGPLTSELRYDVTQLREAAQVRELRAVAEGAGSYDAYGNPRLGGGYELVTSVGDPSTRSRAVLQLRLDTYPARARLAAGKRPGLLRAFGGSTFLRLETLSKLPLGSLEHAFDPRDYLEPENTLRGNLVARQTFEIAPPGLRADARAEVGFRRDRSSEIEALSTSRDAVDARATLRHPLPLRLRGTITVSADRALQSVARTDTIGGYESTVRGRGLEAEISREIRGLGQVSILSRMREDFDETRGGSYLLRSAGPTARYAAGSRLRLDARALWGVTEQRGVYAPPGLYVAAPVGARLDYDLTGEYRMRERIALSFGWTGFKTRGRPATYTGRVELKGSF